MRESVRLCQDPQTEFALVIAAGLRIKDLILDATPAGLVAAQPLLVRMDDLVETAAATLLDTLDHSERATAHLYL